jgi:hypothetical protein
LIGSGDFLALHHKRMPFFNTCQEVEKLRTHRHCEEQSDEASQKPRFNMGERCVFWRKCRLDCFASLAMTGRESSFNDPLGYKAVKGL